MKTTEDNWYDLKSNRLIDLKMKENEYQLVMRLKVKKNLKKLLVLGLSCRQKVEKTHTQYIINWKLLFVNNSK